MRLIAVGSVMFFVVVSLTESCSWVRVKSRSQDWPGPRYSHSAVIHKHSMLVFGGLEKLNPKNDLWNWSFGESDYLYLKLCSALKCEYCSKNAESAFNSDDHDSVLSLWSNFPCHVRAIVFHAYNLVFLMYNL